MSTNITDPCVEAVRLLFAASFNSLVTTAGFPELSIDWSKTTSIQYFEFYGMPENMEAEDDIKYPCVFLHGVSSDNQHEFEGTDFSGMVNLSLRFYVTSAASKLSTAGRYLERAGHAIENAVNEMLGDPGWPQSFGVPGAVGARWPMVRQQVIGGAEEFVQGFLFSLSINKAE